MNKITVIGSGNVGATIAYTLTIMGIGSEIVSNFGKDPAGQGGAESPFR